MLDKGNQNYKKQIDNINKELAELEEDFVSEEKAREYLVRFLRSNIGLTCYWMSGVDLFPFQEIAIKTMFKRDYTLGIWSRGLSKCMNINDLCYSESRGPIKAKDVNVGEKILSKNNFNPVLNKKTNPEDTTYKITTKKGYESEGLDYHRVLVLNKNLEEEWKYSKDLQKNDVLIMRKTWDFPNQQNIFNNITQTVGPQNKRKIIDVTKISLMDWYYLFGLFIGDGNYISNGISITTENIEIKKFLKYVAQSLGLSFNNEINDKLKHISLYSVNLHSIFVQLGFNDSFKAHEKEIPQEILNANKENICVLLRGLFDTDGYCSIQEKQQKNARSVTCGFTSSSHGLIKQVRSFLLQLGIVSKTGITFNGGQQKFGDKYYECRKSWSIIVTSANNVQLFKDNIGFNIKHKKDNLSAIDFYKYKNNEFSEYVPYIGDYLKKKYGRKSFCKKIGYKNIKLNFRKYTSYNLLKKIIDSGRLDQEDYEKFSKLLNSNLFYDHVSSVKTSSAKTIDLTIENERCYVSDGVINHNSFSTGVFAFLYATFCPNSKIAIISKSFRQSREIFKKIEELSVSKNGTLLAECVNGTPKHLNDEWSMKIGSSEVKALPLGDGCQVFDTQILTKSGFKFLGDYIPNNIDLNKDHQEFTKKGTQIWSNEKFRESDQQFYNGIRPTKKITTKKGFSTESTLNHKFKCLNGLQIDWKQAQDYKVGDNIMIDKSVRWHDRDTNLTEDECYAFGAILGDGSLVSSSYIGFATEDIEMVDYLKMGSPFNWVQHKDKVHWYGNGGNSKKLDWLSKFNYLDKNLWRTENKIIPQPILNSSKSKMGAFIRGLFDTDGGVYVQNAKGGTSICVCFYNTSERLVNDLQYVLLHYGIVANITKRQRTEDKRFEEIDWKSSYELHITGKDVLTFANEIGFRLKRKRESLNKAVAEKKRWSSIKSEEIPVDKDVLVNFCKNNRVSRKQGNPYPSLISASAISNKKYITKNLIQKFIEVYDYTGDPLIEKLRELINPNIYFDKIYSIEDGQAPTADVHVPEGNEYTANGFFSHNSKLRGFRFNVLIVDELLLMPEKVINEVITPFLSTNKDPKRLHDIRELEDRLIKEGQMTEDDRFVPEKNKMIGLSSASYTFEPLYKTYKEYITAITTGTEDGRPLKEDKSNSLKGTYAVLQLSYDYAAKRCAGLYDEALLTKAKNQMSKQQFDREFGAQFTDESGGFFNMKTMNQCTVTDGEYPTTEIIGDPSCEYILAIDPAFAENDSSDFFAMTVLKKLSDRKFIVVHAYAVAGGKFKDHVNYFAYLYSFFNIKFIIMDNAGGSTFLQFINQDKRFKDKPFKVMDKPNFNDINDYQKQVRLAKEEYNFSERRIIYYQTFNSDWIRRSNEILQANMDHKRIIFASAAEFIESEFSRQRSINIPATNLKIIGSNKKESLSSIETDDEEIDVDELDKDLSDEMVGDARKVDLIERQGFLLSLMKTQCAFIEVKTSDSGSQSFVLPQNLKNQKGPDRPRRDLYTVLLLGSWANKCYHDFKNFHDDDEGEDGFMPTAIKN